jgi:hypothetical protein
VKFSSFPDDEVEVFGGRRILFAGTEDSGIGDLETMVLDSSNVGEARVVARIELEPGDLEKLQAGAPIYVIQYGGCIPLCVDIPFEVGHLGAAPPLPEVSP